MRIYCTCRLSPRPNHQSTQGHANIIVLDRRALQRSSGSHYQIVWSSQLLMLLHVVCHGIHGVCVLSVSAKFIVSSPIVSYIIVSSPIVSYIIVSSPIVDSQQTFKRTVE